MSGMTNTTIRTRAGRDERGWLRSFNETRVVTLALLRWVNVRQRQA